MRKFSLFLFCFLFFFPSVATAGEVTREGSLFGVEIDVEFTYDIDTDELGPWKAAFNRANLMLWQATRGQMYLKKVNFKICPVDIEGKRGGSSADIFVYKDQPGVSEKGPKISHTIGTLSQSQLGPIILFASDALEFKSENVGHELAHYIFGTYDEYAKPDNSKFTARPVTFPANETAADAGQRLAAGAQIGDGRAVHVSYQDAVSLAQNEGGTPEDYLAFCNKQQHLQPDACVMCGDRRTALNVTGAISGIADYYSGLCGPSDHIKAVFADTTSSGQPVLYRIVNEQSYHKNQSCVSTAEVELALSGVTGLDWNRSGPFGSAPSTEYEEVDDCSNTVVLLLDKSGSMDGARIVDLRRAALGLIDSLDNDTRLGIVWFDSQARTAVELTDLEDNRILAKQAIFGVEASGGTRIGAGLGVAYEVVRRARENVDEPRSREVIFLMTDGESSDDTTSVVNIIRGEDIEISTVALGDEVDADLLGRLAATTGGGSYFAADGNFVEAVTLGVTENLDDYELLQRQTLTGAVSEVNFELDPYVGNSLVRIALGDVDTSGLEDNSFTVTGPQGTTIPAEVRLTVEDENNATVVLVLPKPEPGSYRLSFASERARAGTAISVLVLVQSNTLHLIAGTNLPEGVATFPEATVIQASLLSENGTASGLPVTALVTRPDGSTVEITLFDDGSTIHGDDIPGDGVYSNRFQNYNEDGNYSVSILCDNSAGVARATFGVHSGLGENPAGLLDPFVRERTFSFNLEGFTSLGAGELTVEKLNIDLPDLLAGKEFAFLSGLVVNGFRVQTGPSQAVLLEEIGLALPQELLDRNIIAGFELYNDSDLDGRIDDDGEFAIPLAIVESFETGAGTVTLRDVLELAPNTEMNVLVAMRLQVFEPEEDGATEAGLALLALPLGLLLLTGNRNRMVSILLLVALSVALIAGCGSSNDFVNIGASNSSPQATERDIPDIDAQATLDFSSFKARGAVDGTEININLLSTEPQVGPEVKVR